MQLGDEGIGNGNNQQLLERTPNFIRNLTAPKQPATKQGVNFTDRVSGDLEQERFSQPPTAPDQAELPVSFKSLISRSRPNALNTLSALIRESHATGMSLQDEQALKEIIIGELIAEGRLYYKPRQPFLVRRLTTSLWVYDYDLDPNNRNYLNHKVNQAIHYNNIEDIEVFNFLKELNPRHRSGMFMNQSVLAMYMALADEVSRCPNGSGKTFLQACRDNGLSLKPNQVIKNKDLPAAIKKFEAVLADLGLSGRADMRQIVKDWTTKGNFTYAGELQNDDNKALWKGSYMNLSVAICRAHKSPTMQVSACISRALGHKEWLRGKTLKEAHYYISRYENNWANEKRNIIKGDQTRNRKMWELIYEQAKTREPQKLDEEGEHFFKAMLSKMPLWALNAIYYGGKSIGYTDKNEIREMVPPGDLAGLSDDDAEITRHCAGLNNNANSILLFSNAVLPKGVKPKEITEELVTDCIGRCVIHESTHNILHSPVVETDEDLKFIKQLKKDGLEACAVLQKADTNKYPFLADGSRIGYDNLRYLLSPKPILKYTDGYWPEEAFVIAVTEAATLCPEINPRIYPPNDAEPELTPIRNVMARGLDYIEQVAARMEQRGMVAGSCFSRS